MLLLLFDVSQGSVLEITSIRCQRCWRHPLGMHQDRKCRTFIHNKRNSPMTKSEFLLFDTKSSLEKVNIAPLIGINVYVFDGLLKSYISLGIIPCPWSVYIEWVVQSTYSRLRKIRQIRNRLIDSSVQSHAISRLVHRNSLRRGRS